RAKPVFGFGAVIRIALIQRHIQREQQQKRKKVRFVEHIYVGVGSQVPAIAQEPQRRVKLQLAGRGEAIYHIQVLRWAGHEVLVGSEDFEHHVDRQSTKCPWVQQELREI